MDLGAVFLPGGLGVTYEVPGQLDVHLNQAYCVTALKSVIQKVRHDANYLSCFGSSNACNNRKLTVRNIRWATCAVPLHCLHHGEQHRAVLMELREGGRQSVKSAI